MKKRWNLGSILVFCCLIFSIHGQETCGKEEYKCELSGDCINIEEKICNGIVDCQDHKEDEWTCNDDPTKVCSL